MDTIKKCHHTPFKRGSGAGGYIEITMTIVSQIVPVCVKFESNPYLSDLQDWKFLLHKEIAYNLTMCHGIDQRSFGQFQGHCLQKNLIPFCVISCFKGND